MFHWRSHFKCESYIEKSATECEDALNMTDYSAESSSLVSRFFFGLAPEQQSKV